uniref:Inositol hexakisphosphate and diphosphoinositol-pentakisphosphate kinase n=1 Tax=Rhipicephalus appendiculatus TaxID=34631 RepID=A0A131YZ47_RHIAP
MYPGGQGLGLLRLHSTFRHDLKIYASDEGRVQMTAAAFAKGLLALEGELTPILVQMVKSANTNGLLDNDCDSSKYQNIHYRVKQRLHEAFQVDHDFTEEDFEKLNPTHARSIQNALQFIKNPVKACQHVYEIIQDLIKLIKCRKDESKTHVPLYHGETWELMLRRWAKLEKDFKLKNGKFDISKIPDVYDCIKYDLQHNQHTLQFVHAEELYLYAKALADVVIPQEYGLNLQEKLTIGLGICTPLLKKIRADLHRNIDPAADETESVNRLNPQYSHGVSSPGRHVRTRLYFTSESHIHSLLTVLRYGGLLDETKDEQWRRAMEYVNAVTELNYMTQIVIMLYEDPTKDQHSEERFHVELHFSPGVVCCVQKNLPPGPGFRPQSRSGPREKSSEKGMLGAASHEAGEKHGCIEEEEDELTFDDEGRYEEVWSDHESPTILDDGNSKEAASASRASASVVPPFLSSQPIPIGKVLQCMAMEVHANAVITAPKPAATHTVALMKAPGDEHLRPYPIVRCNSDSQRPRSLDSDAAEPPKVDKGQLSSYLRICSVADLPKVFGSSGSLFSTAVISGSSSAPDLKNLFPTAVADGIVSVPSIRPLETLHNALSLHQLDQFLGKVTSATYRMLLSSVPKAPGSMYSNSQFSALPVASPSSRDSGVFPGMIWSGPPSFVSSSGPSTPTSSTLDIWTKLHQMNENESSAAESSGTTSRNSYSTPPSPHDPRYYNNSL